MSVEHAREELHLLQRRREEVDAAVVQKHAERRDILEKIRLKRERDPESAAREIRLDQEIKGLVNRAQKIRQRIRALRERHHELTDKVDDAEKAVEEARKRRQERHDSGPKKAVEWAMNQVGEHESPSGSNWGEPVETWIKNAGYTFPVPWCGAFCHEAVVEHGGANVSTQLGYAGYIVDDARANRNGLREVSASEAKAGDIASLWNAEHVVTLTGPVVNGTFSTIEGNTSATDGSQSNGGTVAAKVRSVSDVDVFARPSYP